MKKFLPIAISIIVAGAAMLYLIYFATSTRDEMTFKLEQQKLAAKFTSQIAWVRQIQEKYRYENEMKGLIKWYFTEVPKLYKTFGREFDIDAKWKEHLAGDNEEKHANFGGDEKPVKKGNDDEVWKEAYELVKMHWQNWAQGHYDIKLTSGKESVRLDILDIKPDNFGGQKGLRADFVMWGAFSEFHGAACNGMEITIYFTEDEWKKAHPTPEEVEAAKIAKEEADKKAKKKRKRKGKKEEKKEEAQKILGREVRGECNPVIPIRYPFNFVPNFPPEAFISYFQLPIFPAEATFIDIKYNMAFSGRAGTKNFVINFDKIKVDNSWKLAPGQEWKAQTIEQSADQ